MNEIQYLTRLANQARQDVPDVNVSGAVLATLGRRPAPPLAVFAAFSAVSVAVAAVVVVIAMYLSTPGNPTTDMVNSLTSVMQ
jgi:hypothetical protein